jgi:hypothetical protein
MCVQKIQQNENKFCYGLYLTKKKISKPSQLAFTKEDIEKFKFINMFNEVQNELILNFNKFINEIYEPRLFFL